ncbi:MAG: UDP-N-acetylmuramate dehydrogenase [Paludibacteraceae bacterium]|nr:UDP-N-acetylmuramate dehydrogenase [Paludibacteraceae bacterium]
MEKIQYNISLLPYNTFGMDVRTKVFAEYQSIEDLKALLRQFRGERILHIGQGSNLLFTGDFDGVVLHSAMARARFLDDETVEAQNGLRLDDLIAQLTDMHYCGMEKLSLIPGEVGASAVQNVGAYGVEAKDVIVRVHTLDTETLEERVFSNAECRFGYRDSAFKHELRGRYIVTSVVYHVTPGDATKTRQEIIETRNGKLPKVGEVGSAGSFFMNPFVTPEKADELLKLYPDMPHFPSPQGVKIPAAWMIEQCGWKGKRLGGAQVWPRQPLVLVNADNATSADIMRLAQEICESVKTKFGIDIHPEVNYI